MKPKRKTNTYGFILRNVLRTAFQMIKLIYLRRFIINIKEILLRLSKSSCDETESRTLLTLKTVEVKKCQN